MHKPDMGAPCRTSPPSVNCSLKRSAVHPLQTGSDVQCQSVKDRHEFCGVTLTKSKRPSAILRAGNRAPVLQSHTPGRPPAWGWSCDARAPRCVAEQALGLRRSGGLAGALLLVPGADSVARPQCTHRRTYRVRPSLRHCVTHRHGRLGSKSIRSGRLLCRGKAVLGPGRGAVKSTPRGPSSRGGGGDGGGTALVTPPPFPVRVWVRVCVWLEGDGFAVPPIEGLPRVCRCVGAPRNTNRSVRARDQTVVPTTHPGKALGRRPPSSTPEGPLHGPRGGGCRCANTSPSNAPDAHGRSRVAHLGMGRGSFEEGGTGGQWSVSLTECPRKGCGPWGGGGLLDTLTPTKLHCVTLHFRLQASDCRRCCREKKAVFRLFWVDLRQND